MIPNTLEDKGELKITDQDKSRNQRGGMCGSTGDNQKGDIHENEKFYVLDEASGLTENRRTLNTAKTQDQAANKAKSRFLSHMSHELKTPLNAVIGFAQLLARDPLLSRRQRSDVAVILSSGNDLLKMINDLFDFSSIETGQLVVEETNFSFARLLDDTAALFRTRCDDKGLYLAVERDFNLPDFLYGDGDKLKQIIVNLLSNAVQYTPHGSITLRVRSDINPEEHCPGTEKFRLTIEVEDSGVGISKDDLSRIFHPFERADDDGNVGGSGLGLVICREYAGLLGGEIRVKSQKGQGSRFYVTVVMKKGKPVPNVNEQMHRQVIRLHPGTGPVRILVADDDPVNQTLLNAFLTPAGFKVFQALDGQEALTLFERFNPHAVFMDLRMPGMDGIEVAQRIKNIPKGRDTPVIALTASTFEEDRQRIEHAGMDTCIQKPFQGRQIFKVLERCLGLRYVYEDSTELTFHAVAHRSISLLPNGLRCSLRQAVEDGNMIRFSELLVPFEASYPDLTAMLGHMAENFKYSELLAILEKPDGSEDRHSKEYRDDL